MAGNEQPSHRADPPSISFDPDSLSFLLDDNHCHANGLSGMYAPMTATTGLYRSSAEYVVPFNPRRREGERNDSEHEQQANYAHLWCHQPKNRYRTAGSAVQYKTNERARQEDRFRPDAPVVFVAPFIDMLLLPPDQMGSKNIRGYCTPGYQNDKAARIRNNDEDPWRVYLHEYFHFAKVHGGDGSEEYVHLMEHWRMEEDS